MFDLLFEILDALGKIQHLVTENNFFPKFTVDLPSDEDIMNAVDLFSSMISIFNHSNK